MKERYVLDQMQQWSLAVSIDQLAPRALRRLAASADVVLGHEAYAGPVRAVVWQSLRSAACAVCE